MQQETAGASPRGEVPASQLPKLPMLDRVQPALAGRAEQAEAPYEDSPRHTGAAPSRLPRPPSATSPRPGGKR